MRACRIMSIIRTTPISSLAIPLLTLPMVLGAIWLWYGMAASRPQPYWLLLIGMIVAALYLLGLVIGSLGMRVRLATRRHLRRLRPSLSTEAGGEDGLAVWASDPEGRVLWQSPAAISRFGDRLGIEIATAFARLIADPQAAIPRLIGRAVISGDAGMPVSNGRLRVQVAGAGALLLWRLDDDVSSTGSTPEPRIIEGFDSLPVALITLDHAKLVTRANVAARILLPGLVPGVSFSSLLDGLGRPVEDWLDDVLNGRIAPRPEMLRSRNGEGENFVQVSLARDGADGLVAVLTDASMLKTLQTQFVQSQKMQAIGQLAGGIAHYFNNLLTAISGHCDLLMVGRDATDPDYADIDQISQNANRAASLVGQLLAFSRKQTMKPEIIDLRDTMPELMHLLRRLVGERITLGFDADPDLHPIRIDPRQLDQVVMNLVVNARDAMPEGGRIGIRTVNLHLDEAMSRDRTAVPSGDYVRIDIRDEGAGIPAEQLEKIFEPFFTTKRVGEGTGLGLSTVYGIIKQSGGYVFCDSEPGQGTVFSIYLPAHDPAELEVARKLRTAQPAVAAGPGRPASVLLVEDEAAVRAFAVRALRLRGFEVAEAESAEAALELLADPTRHFDVFVTDVVMPGMDGPSWVQIALRDRPQTRVIFMSGYSEDIFSNEALPGVAYQFLQKPFALDQLTNLVREQADLDPTQDGAGEGSAKLS